MSCPSKPFPVHGRMRRGRAPAGFTFIELIIAMVLLSVVMTLLYTSFGQVSNNVRTLSRDLSERQEMRLLIKMISDELLGARYFEEFAKIHEGQSGIKASKENIDQNEFTRIQFHSAVPTRFYRKVPPQSDPHMHEIGYWVQLADDRKTLQLVRREDFYLDGNMEDGGEEVVLTDGVSAFLIEFVSPNNAGGTNEKWLPEWESASNTARDRMPAAVRVTLAKKNVAGGEIRESQEYNLVIGNVTK